MRSVPYTLPSVSFPNFGNVSCFTAFAVFLTKKEENMGKKTVLEERPFMVGGSSLFIRLAQHLTPSRA